VDTAKYTFKALESKYGGFVAPSFEVTVGSARFDAASVPVSELTVDIEAGYPAGGARIVIEAMYDSESGKWQKDLLDKVKAGAKLTVSAGYLSKKQVFYGFVDDFSVEYDSAAPPRIAVSGIDAKGFLMNAANRQYMSEKKSTAVIKEILSQCVSKGYASKVTMGSIKDFEMQLIQEDMNDYAFLCSLAEMYAMSFFVVNGEIVFDDVVGKRSSMIELTMGVSLLSFSKTQSLRGQLGKVEVFGVDPKTKKPIKGAASSTTISGCGSEAHGIASGFGALTRKINSFFASTPEECAALAQAVFDRRAINFVSGRGRCIGLPELIPGRYITLEGMDSATNGDYFIEKVRHVFSSEEGYFTEFEVKGAKSK
jgi:phage protein D